MLVLCVRAMLAAYMASHVLFLGVYKYEYVCRATTAGRFIVPPARAEEMYSPEVFGRSSTNIMIIQ